MYVEVSFELYIDLPHMRVELLPSVEEVESYGAEKNLILYLSLFHRPQSIFRSQ